MFEVLQVRRSSYYEYLKGVVCKREGENKKLLAVIKQLHQKSKQGFGSPLIQQALKAQQMTVSQPRVARLMK